MTFGTLGVPPNTVNDIICLFIFQQKETKQKEFQSRRNFK